MGFYAPAQIVSDARQHGVTVCPVDVLSSDWACSLEPVGNDFALRLGLRQLRGFDQASAQRLVAARTQRPFVDVEALLARASLAKPACEALARRNAPRRPPATAPPTGRPSCREHWRRTGKTPAAPR